MQAWVQVAADLLWRNGLAVIPLAAVAAIICRCFACRPATRHMLWLTVLAWFIAPLLLPVLDVSAWTSRSSSAPEQAEQAETPEAARIASSDATPSEVEEPAIAVDLRPPGAAGEFLSIDHPRRPPPARPSALPALALNQAIPQQSRSDIEFQHAADATGTRPRGNNPHRTESDLRTMPISATGSVRPKPTRADPRVGGADGDDAQHHSDSSRIALRPIEADAPDPEQLDPQRGQAATAEPSDRIDGRDDSGDGRNAIGSAWSLTATLKPVLDLAARIGEMQVLELWAAGLLRVRDEIERLPALPAEIWLGGIGALAAVVLLRAGRFRRTVRRAVAAPPSVNRIVAHVARLYGLKAVPEAFMVESCVSPMILAGPRTRLILPRRLWEQLDETGRWAIVSHELAHVRRRDHWVCWLELAVTGLFWWHPVLWWARHRLHEEAELCCDAWVTWLMPRGRRAYAETLLRTKQYIADQGVPVTAMGIGVTTSRARNLARRIKMVMTESVRPRISITGLALVLTLSATGWIATPAWSCPDKDKVKAAKAADEKKACEAACAAKAAECVAATAAAPARPAAVAAPMTMIAPAPLAVTSGSGDEAGGQPTLLRLAQPRPSVPALAGMLQTAPTTVHSPGASVPALMALQTSMGDDHALQERMERLESQVRRLTEQLERMTGPQAAAGGLAGAYTQPFTPQPPRGAPSAPFARSRSGGGTGGAAAGGGAFGGVATPTPSDNGQVIVRAYKLPKRKLEALTGLLLPDDVPLRVRPLEDAIEVHGTAREQQAFEAFLKLIQPDGNWRRAGEGDGEGRGKRTSDARAAVERYQEALRAAGVDRAQLAASTVDRARLRELLSTRAEQLRSHVSKRQAETAEIEAQVERMTTDAESVRERAQEMAAKALETLQGADQAAAQADMQRAQKELEQKARELEKKAREMERKARKLEAESSRIEQQMETIDTAMEGLDSGDESGQLAGALDLSHLDALQIDLSGLDKIEFGNEAAEAIEPALESLDAIEFSPETPVETDAEATTDEAHD